MTHKPGSIQRRRKIGRQYLQVFGWAALALNCALAALVVLSGKLNLRHAATIVSAFMISAVLILVARKR